MTPSQPGGTRHDENLPADEVEERIAVRYRKQKRTRNTRVGGYVVGFSGLIFAFVTALILDNTLMAFLGFSMSLVGFGVASLDQVVKLIRSVKNGDE
jgi:tetrahydromethanopterin S-methyltransferase subunit F